MATRENIHRHQGLAPARLHKTQVCKLPQGDAGKENFRPQVEGATCWVEVPPTRHEAGPCDSATLQ